MTSMHIPPLFGLVLAGGASTRMQRDKAALSYHGRTQLQWTYDLIAPFCAATFVSVRPDQRAEATRASFPQIVDRQTNLGPIGGISAALLEHPKVAWLVVACDLPLITPETLQYLVKHRDARRVATAYRSSHDQLPEPLCAIWEPHAREAIQAYIDSGKQCPRKLLIHSDTAVIDLPDARALENVNTPTEFDAAMALVSGHSPRETGQESDVRHLFSAPPKHIRQEPALPSSLRPQVPYPMSQALTLRVQYYAVLREQAGRSEETLDTAATTPAALYDELRARHPFQLDPTQLKVAINADFRDWETPLKSGDTVVFIPPVAGG